MCLEISKYHTENFKKDGKLPQSITNDEPSRVGEDENGKYFIAYKVVQKNNRPPWYYEYEYSKGVNDSKRGTNKLSELEERYGEVHYGFHLYTSFTQACVTCDALRKSDNLGAKILECVCYFKDVIVFGFNDEVAMNKVTVLSLKNVRYRKR